MRSPLKILFEATAALCLMLLVCAWSPKDMFGGSKPQDDPGSRIESLDTLMLPEILHSVNTDKYADLIREFQHKEGLILLKEYKQKKGKCTVETYRNKEVLLVTIPADRLFMPNETELRPDASSYLSPLKRYLKDPDMYRMLLVMHTDNTGSEAYRDELTLNRVDAVFDWFEQQDLDTRYLFSYAYGDDMPLYGNNSINNRSLNRRLEVYLMPGEKMVEQAKKGRIAF